MLNGCVPGGQSWSTMAMRLSLRSRWARVSGVPGRQPSVFGRRRRGGIVDALHRRLLPEIHLLYHVHELVDGHVHLGSLRGALARLWPAGETRG